MKLAITKLHITYYIISISAGCDSRQETEIIFTPSHRRGGGVVYAGKPSLVNSDDAQHHVIYMQRQRVYALLAGETNCTSAAADDASCGRSCSNSHTC